MKLILFIIVFTCIIVIRFFAFILRSAFDAAQIVNEKPRNTISKTYDRKISYTPYKNLFANYILVIREQKLCSTQYIGTIEEMVIAMEFYFFFIAFVLCHFENQPWQETTKLRNKYLHGIIDYLKKNLNTINMYTDYSETNGPLNTAFYNFENIRDLFKKRYEKYSYIIKNFPAGDPHTEDGFIKTFIYLEKISTIIKDSIHDSLELENFTTSEEIFCAKNPEIFETIANIQVVGEEMAKEALIEMFKYY